MKLKTKLQSAMMQKCIKVKSKVVPTLPAKYINLPKTCSTSICNISLMIIGKICDATF